MVQYALASFCICIFTALLVPLAQQLITIPGADNYDNDNNQFKHNYILNSSMHTIHFFLCVSPILVSLFIKLMSFFYSTKNCVVNEINCSLFSIRLNQFCLELMILVTAVIICECQLDQHIISIGIFNTQTQWHVRYNTCKLHSKKSTPSTSINKSHHITSHYITSHWIRHRKRACTLYDVHRVESIPS